jgi:hypothetical protein
VQCDRLGVGGVGVCLLGPSRLVLLVRGALPGETLLARITAVKKGGHCVVKEYLLIGLHVLLQLDSSRC